MKDMKGIERICWCLEPFVGFPGDLLGRSRQVGDAVKGEVVELPIPDEARTGHLSRLSCRWQRFVVCAALWEEKLEIVNAAMTAAAKAEKPGILMDGSSGIDPSLAGWANLSLRCVLSFWASMDNVALPFLITRYPVPVRRWLCN